MVRYKNWKKTEKDRWYNESGAYIEIDKFQDEEETEYMKPYYLVTLWKPNCGDHIFCEATATIEDARFIATEFIKNNDVPNIGLNEAEIIAKEHTIEIMDLGATEWVWLESDNVLSIMLYEDIKSVSLKTLKRFSEIFKREVEVMAHSQSGKLFIRVIF